MITWLCSDFKVATEMTITTVWHCRSLQTNKLPCLKFNKMPYDLALCIQLLLIDTFFFFFLLNPWSGWWRQGKEDVFIFTCSPDSSLQLHAYYKITVSGGRAELITIIKCGTAGGRLWTCGFFVFVAVELTVFDSGKWSVNWNTGVHLWIVWMQWWKRLTVLWMCKVIQSIRKHVLLNNNV